MSNHAQTDGRIQLNASKLKQLRRTLGISQEELSFRCAEQKLYISIASIKRAETSKNVLYRTANELAKFYQLPVEELASPPKPKALKKEPNTIQYFPNSDGGYCASASGHQVLYSPLVLH